MNYDSNVATRHALTGAAVALAFATTPALAGSDAKSSIIEEPAPKTGDFCSWLGGKPGTLYKSKTNPYIQEIGFFGRLHYQGAWIDGKSDGQDFWYDNGGQFRRARLGARVKFLNYFHVWANADMVRDTRSSVGGLDWGYQNLYEAQILFDAQKAFNWDSHSKFNVGYGKSEVKVAYESNTSSKKIKTIERSAISNKIFSAPMTGAWVDAKIGKWGYYGGVFSTAADTEVAGWDAGTLYTARANYDLADAMSFDAADVHAAISYIDHKEGTGIFFNYKWATSLAFTAEQGRANYLVNMIYGDNRDDALTPDRGGQFWGFVFMPSYWITENNLEAVFRYQYQGASESKGIRLNSRYARNAGVPNQENIPVLAGGRGDQHHSAYLGLNYYFCGNNSKVMAGIEYDDFKSDGTAVYQGITYSLAYRMYF